MKKITLLLSFLCLGFANQQLSAQNFSDHAKAEIAKNNYLPALDELTTFLEANPNNEILLTYRANFYAKAGQNEKAIADATQVMLLNPKSTHGLITLGTAKMALGKTQEGVESLNQALAIQPNLKPALILRSKAYFKLNQPEKSLADLSFLIKDDPKNLEAYVYRGQLYTAMKQLDSAKADYQFILNQAVVGDKYHSAATDKLKEVLQKEAAAKAALTQKATDDAYAKKLTDQVTSLSKEVNETTARLTKMLTEYTTEISRFMQKNDAIPKTDWQGKAQLFQEINPRIKTYLTNLQKERTYLAGKEAYRGLMTNIEGSISAMNLIIERTSPYAARRQQFVETVNAMDAAITVDFKNMLAAQKSRQETTFEQQKKQSLAKTQELLISINQSREALLKLDATKYREQDESKITKLLADYTKTLANINGIVY